MGWRTAEILAATGGKMIQDSGKTRFGEIVTDSTKVKTGSIFVALKGERHDGHRFVGDAVRRGAGCVIAHRSLPKSALGRATAIKVADTLTALGDLAHYRRQQFAPKVLAITGSNGKTTTKEMVAAILQEAWAGGKRRRGKILKTEGNFNNLVGLPLTLLRLRKQDKVAVVELGTNQPGEIQRLTEIADPDIGIITSVAAAHLEGLNSLAGVAREKGGLYRGMRPNGTIVVNLDDPWVRKIAALRSSLCPLVNICNWRSSGAATWAARSSGGYCAPARDLRRSRFANPQPRRASVYAWTSAWQLEGANCAASIAGANVVVLAVKPQDLRGVVAPLRECLQNTCPLVLSIAAGVRIDALRIWCGAGVPIARAMPNRPALLGAGATGIYAGHDVPASSRALAERVLKGVGAVVWLDSEASLDVVTALSGSGPAYFFLLADAMRQSAVDLGLDPRAARLLAMETLYGAGLQAHHSDGDLVRLREEVTSKGGTTEAAIRSLVRAEFAATIHAALEAAAHRSRELAAQFGSS